MNIIIDANILISGLIKDSSTRKSLFSEKFNFYIPEYIITEVNKYIPEISEKAKLTQKEIINLFNLILEHLIIVPFNDYKEHLEKAVKIVANIDEKDAQYIALALFTKNNGIWSNDKHLKNQVNINVLTTKDMLNYL